MSSSKNLLIHATGLRGYAKLTNSWNTYQLFNERVGSRGTNIIDVYSPEAFAPKYYMYWVATVLRPQDVVRSK